MSGFLGNKKDLYLNQGHEVCINVISSQVNNAGEIAEKIKSKKPHYLIFDGVPHETASAIEKAVSKKCPTPPGILKSEEQLKTHLGLN